MVWLLYLGYIIFAFINNATKLSAMVCSMCDGNGPNLKGIFSENSPPTLVKFVKVIVLSVNVIAVMSFNTSLLLLFWLHARFKCTCFCNKLK